MSKFKRILSSVMAGIMLASSGTVLPMEAFASGSVHDLTINWGYNTSDSTPEGALIQEANNGFQAITTTNQTEAETFLKDHYSEFRWAHVKSWNANSKDYAPEKPGIGENWQADNYEIENPLRDALTDSETTYIALYGDDEHEVHAHAVWEEINITSDKVLDLNGHTLHIRFNRNRDNKRTQHQQNPKDLDVFNETAFSISNGATLTIIDSSAWRGEGDGGKGTGTIIFNGYAVDPYSYNINHYTTRDLFHVNDGNLVIYGGTFQAGREKGHVKSDFSLDELKAVIGSTIQLGIAAADYAMGLNSANAAYQDMRKKMLESTVNTTGTQTQTDTGNTDNGTSGTPTITPRDGTNQNPAKPDPKANTPTGEGTRDQTVSEKNQNNAKNSGQSGSGNQQGQNQANEQQNAKDDKNTKIAEKENEIVKAVFDGDKLNKVVDTCFTLVDQFADLLGMKKGSKATITQQVFGTVVRVGMNGTFAAYGGTFKGYGSTPNTRNAVVEVAVNPYKASGFDKKKYEGGLAYIYGGTFEAYGGANVFNMVSSQTGTQKAVQAVEKNGVRTWETVALSEEETHGLQVFYYENQEAYARSTAEQKASMELIPINTGNVQVRNGLFRCFYNALNVAVRQDGDDEHCRIFPGTMGAVNLGANSFNNELIQDGRIQIIDRYGDGALVLMDDRKDDPNQAGGLYHYRLYCGDTELRYKSYLEVYPNNEAAVGAARSMQLVNLYNEKRDLAQIYTNDNDNIRAPYKQTEYYFDYVVDNTVSDKYVVKPYFFNSSTQSMTDYTGQHLDDSEVWYYPKPLSHKVVQDGVNTYPLPIPDPGYGDEIMIKDSSISWGDSTNKIITSQKDLSKDDHWAKRVTSNHLGEGAFQSAAQFSNDSIRTSIKYFTWKVYRVDPLTRENISEDKDNAYADAPLITVRYGVNDEAIKCVMPFDELQERIGKAQGYQEGAFRFSAGEMYRITLDVEEHVGIGYWCEAETGFGDKLQPAKTHTSILFRCCTQNENTDNGDSTQNKTKIFTPVRFLNTGVTQLESGKKVGTIKAGDNAAVTLLNGKAGLIDYTNSKIFDLYYLWWEVDEDGTIISDNPRMNTISRDTGKPYNMSSLFAGTTNIYRGSFEDKSDHIPPNWHPDPEGSKFGTDGKIYVNTIDPYDPNAETYLKNGLPADPMEWTDKQIHMYSLELTGKEALKKDPEKELKQDNNNNNIFATNTDRCYIPEKMAGEFIRVCVIAVNKQWNQAFDEVQTFWSPVVKVEEADPITAQVQINYTGAKDYGTMNNPVYFGLNVNGLRDDEKVASFKFVVKSDRERTYEGKSLGEMAMYPYHFMDESETDITTLNWMGDLEVYAEVTTSFGRTCTSGPVPFTCYAETLRVDCLYEDYASKPIEIDATDIKYGKYDGGLAVFTPYPRNATLGFSTGANVSEYEDIVTLDDNGKLHFTGKTGTSRIEAVIPAEEGETKVTLTIHVAESTELHSFERVEMKAPTCTESGWIEHYQCKECGRKCADAEGTILLTAAELTLPKSHDLLLHEKTAATCTGTGTIEYWSCKRCEKLFSDKSGKNEISTDALTVSASSHKLTHHDKIAATCTEAGSAEHWVCDGCGKSFADKDGKTEISAEKLTIPATGHAFTHTGKKAATCTKAGSVEYWECTSCRKYYADQDGKTELSAGELTILPLGHALTHHDKKTATCQEAGMSEYWECTRCEQYYSDAEGKNAVSLDALVIPKLAHSLVYHEKIAATDTQAGSAAYWECTACKEFFGDKDGKTLLAADDLIIPPTGHAFVHRDKKAPTCTEAGTIEYWECAHCSKYYVDKDGKTEVSADKLIVPATGHALTHHDKKAEACTESGSIEYWECTNCKQYFADKDGKTVISADKLTTAPLGHAFVHHNKKAATCTEAGSAEYWECTNCKKNYGDKEGKTELSADKLTIAPLGHTLTHHDKKAAACTESGSVEYWECAHCSKYYADKDGKTEISADKLTVPATGHAWSEWMITKQPTESAEGEETRSCSYCGNNEKRAVAKKEAALTTTNSVQTETTTATTASGSIGSTSQTEKSSTVTASATAPTAAETPTTASVHAAETTASTSTAATAAGTTTTATVPTASTTTTSEAISTETTAVNTASTGAAETTTVSSGSESQTTETTQASDNAKAGDVNGDGNINLKDVVLLRRYIAGGWSVTINEKTVDVNSDGNINLKDVVMLRRLIAGGWGISL